MAEIDVTLVLISRREARERGLVHYFTGIPCVAGHVAPIYVGCNKCTLCHKARSKQQKQKITSWHAARIAAKQRGDLTYDPGKPCIHGHVAHRDVYGNNCIICARKTRAASKKKPPQNPIRLAAKKAGESTYIDGTPCRKGHQSPARFTVNASCMVCSAEKSMKQRRTEREADPVAYYVKQNLLGLKYRAAAKPYQAVYQSNRRTRKRGLPGSYTKADVEALRVAQKGRCFWCDKETTRLEVDHIHPVAKDGPSDPGNLVLACRTCNASKGNRDAIEWATEKGYA